MESNFTIRLREVRLMRQFSMKKLSELTGSASRSKASHAMRKA